MLGHAFYQVTVLLVLMIEGHTLLGVPDGIAYYEAKCEYRYDVLKRVREGVVERERGGRAPK